MNASPACRSPVARIKKCFNSRAIRPVSKTRSARLQRYRSKVISSSPEPNMKFSGVASPCTKICWSSMRLSAWPERARLPSPHQTLTGVRCDLPHFLFQSRRNDSSASLNAFAWDKFSPWGAPFTVTSWLWGTARWVRRPEPSIGTMASASP